MPFISIPELYTFYKQYPTVQIDSRKIQAGDIYFALKGENFDGNNFALSAIENGASYAVVDDASLAENAKCILVEDVLNSLQQLALYHRKQFDIPFIAITGSNGKTTTKELITQVLSSQYKTYATEGNLNNHIGVPLTILKIRDDAEMAVIEMGANHQHEIASYCAYTLPNYGLITNCGKAHLEGFGGIEGVQKGKGELYDSIRKSQGTIFRYSDYEYLLKMAHGIEKQITYGIQDADVIGKAIIDNYLLKVAIYTQGIKTEIPTQLVGEYNLPNVLAAVCIGLHFDISIEKIKHSISNYTPSNSRSQLIQKGSNEIISDAYNANPSSMKLALENLCAMSGDSKWAFLGGMKEMGHESEKEHQQLIDLAERLNLQNVILVGEEFVHYKHHFTWFATSVEAANYFKDHPINNAVILVKGSRGSKMEFVIEVL